MGRAYLREVQKLYMCIADPRVQNKDFGFEKLEATQLTVSQDEDRRHHGDDNVTSDAQVGCGLKGCRCDHG